MKRTKKTRLKIVKPNMRSMLRWLKDFEADALDLACGGHPDHIDERREIVALRMAILRKIVRDFTCELPRTITVSVRVDP